MASPATVKRNQSLPLGGKQTAALREGSLHKRQRGKNKQDLRNLRFQPRHCVLSSTHLRYYNSKRDVGHKSKGHYPVARIKIVEEVPHLTFREQFCFQIGNEKEMMYFRSSSNKEKDEWMETFRITAFSVQKNKQLPRFHTGVYGQLEKNQWSCCNKLGREAEGCAETTKFDPEKYLAEHQRPQSCYSPDRPELTSSGPSSIQSPSLTISPYESFAESDSCSDDERGLSTSAPVKKSTLSLDSGKGSSSLTVDLVGLVNSPSFNRRVQRQDSKTSTDTIVEENDNSDHSSVPLEFSCKHSIVPPEPAIDSSTVLFRGADTVISATDTGKVYSFKLNMEDPVRESLLSGLAGPVSLSGWKSHLAIGSPSAQVNLVDLDNQGRTRQLNKGDYGHQQLAVFSPAGSLFTASIVENIVHQWPNPAAHSKKPSQPSASFQIAQPPSAVIFSLAMSPHPEQPWLAVGLTVSNLASDFASVYNYQTKEFLKHIEIGMDSKLHMAFTHNGRYLFLGSDLRIQHLNLENGACHNFYTLRKDVSITSMSCSPVRYHLAVGLSNGDIKVFTSQPGRSIKTPHTLKNEGLGAVTSLSYSRDGMRIAAGFRNGAIQIWKASTAPKERPLLSGEPLTITSQASRHDFPQDGYSIFIPEGAVREGECVTLHHGVAPDSPYGPYQFSDSVRPVSAIVSLEPEPKGTVFLKPIELTLTHCLACETPEDLQKLAFYKTDYNYTVQGGSKVYRFEEFKDGEMIHFSEYYIASNNVKVPRGAATLRTLHCCDLCIAAYCSEDVLDCSYSLRQIVPRNPDLSQEFQVHYCLLYLLNTCARKVEEQFPSEDYETEEMVVKFTAGRALKITTDSNPLEGGWKLRLIPELAKIDEEQLNFWNEDICYKIEELCRSGQYPPRIPMWVAPGQQLSEGVHTTVSFSGVQGVCGATVIFNLTLLKSSAPVQNQTLPLRHVSSSASCSSEQPSIRSNFSLSEARDDFQDNFYNIAHSVKEPKRLAAAFFSFSSKRKCPYLDESDIQEIFSFLQLSKQDDNFSLKFDILSIAMKIARKHSNYMIAVRNVFRDVLSEQDKEKLGISWLLSSRTLLSRPNSNSVSTVGYSTADDSSPPPSLAAQSTSVASTSTMVSNGFPPHLEN